MYVFIPSDTKAPVTTLEKDIERGLLDVRRLLLVSPSGKSLDHYEIGLLIDTKYVNFTEDEAFYKAWNEAPKYGKADYFDLPLLNDSGDIRWYATLSKNKPPKSYLGLYWTFVAHTPEGEEGKDDMSFGSDGFSKYAESDDEDQDAELDEEDKTLNAHNKAKWMAHGYDWLQAMDERSNDMDVAEWHEERTRKAAENKAARKATGSDDE